MRRRALDPRWLFFALVLLGSPSGFAAESLSLTAEDGAEVRALLYPGGTRAVVLAHGGQYTKESWRPQALALAARGFTVLALDFRGFGESTGPGADDPLNAPLHLDLLAAVRHLRSRGAQSISIVGGSLGGMAAGDAAIAARPGEIERIVFLGSRASLRDDDVKKITGRKLFIVARGDANASGPRLPRIRADFERVPEPRELVLVEGSAHAQALFDTDQGAEVLSAVVDFLTAD
jgi:pimeloyl-ACP methyl ester carboxylesterase